MFTPVELLPTSKNLAALTKLAFLYAWSKPAIVNLLVLPPTSVGHLQKTTSLVIHHTINLNYCDVCQQQ
jgi:hypothetical protein